MIIKLLKQRVRQARLRGARVVDDNALATQAVGNWAIWPGSLHPQSVVYSFGVGENISWDLEMIRRFSIQVHAFDPTPASIAWVKRQRLPEQFVFHDYGIAAFDGELMFYPPRRLGDPHYSQERRGGWFGRSSAALLPVAGRAHPTDRRQPVAGRVHRLATILQMLGHQRIDVLKLDVEGTEFEAIPDILASRIEIDQLLIEIHYQFRSRSFRQGLELIASLKAYGMQCVHASERGFEFVFLRRGVERRARVA